MSARRILSGLVAVVLAACTADPRPPSTPAPASSPAATTSPSRPRIPFASASLRREITRDHLRAILIDLQAVADEERRNRAAGTPGYEASVGVVRGRVRALGLRIDRQRFTMPVFSPLGPAVISGPGIAPLRDGRDFRAVLYSGSGDVSGPLHEVGPAGAAGCDEGDFGSLPRGGVALAVSGGCSTATKVTNAQAAGAAALLIERPDALPGMPLRPATFSSAAIAIPAVRSRRRHAGDSRRPLLPPAVRHVPRYRPAPVGADGGRPRPRGHGPR